MLGSYIISWSIRLTTGRAICDPTLAGHADVQPPPDA